MVQNASANTKRAFTLVEFLVALVILTLTGIALFNTVVFFIHQQVKKTIIVHTSDAVEQLKVYSEKLNNCNNIGACASFSGDCYSSISCNEDYCYDSNKCVICYTNPDNGKKIFYSFNASKIDNNTYLVTLCWNFTGSKGFYNAVISLPK